jgi:hypothetical protein
MDKAYFFFIDFEYTMQSNSTNLLKNIPTLAQGVTDGQSKKLIDCQGTWQRNSTNLVKNIPTLAQGETDGQIIYFLFLRYVAKKLNKFT